MIWDDNLDQGSSTNMDEDIYTGEVIGVQGNSV